MSLGLSIHGNNSMQLLIKNQTEMKKLSKLKLRDLQQQTVLLSKEEQAEFIGGGNVSISVNRLGYGGSSTLGVWLATAYDDNGNAISSLTGYFLEPGCDYSRCTYEGSDTAIYPGTYGVIPSTFHGASGYFEIVGVNGRSYIKIHNGSTGEHTSGCMLPGTTYAFDPKTGEYSVHKSREKLNELRDFLNQFGGGGISINISY